MIPIAKPIVGYAERMMVSDVLGSGCLAEGLRVRCFEEQFARYVGVRHAVAVSSGTAALHLALLSMGVGRGDEVVVPDLGFVATANSVLMCGATPVFCDVDPELFTIDVESMKDCFSDKTKAVIPVHLFGQPCDMKMVEEYADEYGVVVVGDACQAHGARYGDKRVGGFGEAECFSFYPTKNMTTGEGGMVTTDSDAVAGMVRCLRNHGRDSDEVYGFRMLGFNYRMTDIAGALGCVQLQQLDEWNRVRNRNAIAYYVGLQSHIVDTPKVGRDCTHVFHQFTVKTRDREGLVKRLQQNDIGYGVYYPYPLHKYRHLMVFEHEGCKNVERVAEQVVSLPVHPGVSEDDVRFICDVVNHPGVMR